MVIILGRVSSNKEIYLWKVMNKSVKRRIKVYNYGGDKMKYDFETLVNRSGMYSRKWERMLKRKEDMPKDIPPFSVADTDFKYPPQLIEGFNEYTNSMIFGYSRPTMTYYQSFIDWVARRNHFDIKREWILDGNGVVPAIYTAIEAFSNKGDGVMMMTPVYPPFKQSIIDTERTIVNVPLLNDDHHFTMDYDLFESLAKDPKNKILILCSPHNPVGRVWTKEELLKLADICNENDILVVSDEIHMDLILGDHTHYIYSSLNEASLNNSIVLTSSSKTFNIAGTQTSMTIIPNEALRTEFERVQSKNAFFGLNAFGFKLAEICYSECEDWLDELLEVVYDNHKYLYDFINTQVDGVEAVKLEGTYLQWIDFSGLEMSDEVLFDFLVDEASLFLTAGVGYGEGGAQYLRWNIATPKHVMVAGLDRLKKAVDSL